MSSAWGHFPTSEEAPDFLVTLEVYISNAAGASLKKPQPKSKKLDKRESTADDLRLRERVSSNWLSSQKSLPLAGHWRSATCRLEQEENERCLLKVYVDESQLFQTVYIHTLNQSDIRPTEPSLFHKKDCIGIFCSSNQRRTLSNTTEPLYLSFANADICATWQTLLKSYAVPEIYGRWSSQFKGGCYRMWRQVELTVVQGRNIRVRSEGGNRDDDGDGGEIDISCEVHLNDILCSRTTVKRGSGAVEWHEAFSFPGLPPFDNLDVVLWKEKKMTKAQAIGTTRIALTNFRRGDMVDGWFPVTQPGALNTELQMGELRLKIRVDEEIIMPSLIYEDLLDVYASRNFLDWITELESALRLKNTSNHLVNIAIARNTVVKNIEEYAGREVDNSNSSHTLFRGNTTFTKVVEIFMNYYGRSFLEASVGSILRRLCAEKVTIEVDSVRSGSRSAKEAERQLELLLYWCKEFWEHIYAARMDCPNEMRKVFRTIRKLVEQKYKPTPTEIDQHNNLPWQSVSAFIFLRFIVPAILHPHLFGLVPGLPPEPIQRSLTQIARAIQSLANLNPNSRKQDTTLQDFHKDCHQAMMDYIAVVSTPLSEATSTSYNTSDQNRRDRLTVSNVVLQRKKKMGVLSGESIPVLPHLIDVPKHLAVITSAVIRNSRELGSSNQKTMSPSMAKFCDQCFQVEEEALRRVSQLAAGLGRVRRQPLQDATDPSQDEPPTSPRSIVTSTCVGPSASGQSRKRRISRPATAPSPTVSDTPRRPAFFSENMSSPRPVNREVQPHRPWNNGHAKAPSTGSTPKIVREAASPVRLPPSVEVPEKVDDETGKRKKGLLGFLRKQ